MKRTATSIATIALLAGCSSAAAPTRSFTEAIHGDFFERPWSHSRTILTGGFNHLTLEVTFSGDYNDRLWIEVGDGSQIAAQAIATGYFEPTKRVDVDLTPDHPYELRIWTDKCCTRYEGLITRTR